MGNKIKENLLYIYNIRGNDHSARHGDDKTDTNATKLIRAHACRLLVTFSWMGEHLIINHICNATKGKTKNILLRHENITIQTTILVRSESVPQTVRECLQIMRKKKH